MKRRYQMEQQRAVQQFLRIPTKKIAHSELMTIRTSPSDTGNSIVEQVIVMVKKKVL
jgi:hypothetical protein